jgi:hypothetical protein
MNYDNQLTIRKLAKKMAINENKLRKKLVELGILEQRTNGIKKPYLLTDDAIKNGIGEVRYKDVGYGRIVPYNIFFYDELITYLYRLKRLRTQENKQKYSFEQIAETFLLPTINVDCLKENSHESADLTDDQKLWLWHEHKGWNGALNDGW